MSAADYHRQSGHRWSVAVLAVLARLCPWQVSPGDELERSLSFLGSPVAPDVVVRGGYGAGVVAGLLSLPVVLLAAPRPLLAVLPVLGVTLATVHAVHRLPVHLAAARRTTALGSAPGIVARAVLRMRVAPTAESAAAFAADTGRGSLADSLRDHVYRSAGTPRTGLSSFADEWGEWFPALRRATGLVVAAADAPPGERSRTLDRAMATVLDGTRDRMAAFAGEIRAPVTALYAFGVLLPLALVAVVPAAPVAGIPVSAPLLAAVYVGVLPAGVLAVGGWLLLRRPVAFPPPTVGRDHPDVPDRRWPFLAAGLAVGVAAFVVVPGWPAPVVAAGGGVGVALVGYFRPIARVRGRVRSVEDGLPDALHLVGRRVAEGEAVETAIERAADEVPGATGEVLADAARTGRTLRVGVRASFLGEYGALSAFPSPRARGAATLLATAAEEGRPAGSAVVAMADHLDELETVERAARRELARVTDTLGHTAAAFGPLVAGATVALSEQTSATAPTDPGAGTVGTAGALADAAGTIPTASLGTVVGAYVLVSAVLLTALAAGLERGLDPTLVGYRAGRALLSATAVYVATFWVVGALV